MRCHSDAFGRVGRRGAGRRRRVGSTGGAEPVGHGVEPREVGGVGHVVSRTVNEETTLPISF